MPPGQLIALLVCLGVAVTVVFGFEIAVFRVACRLCRVPQPGLIRTVGMVSVLLVVPGLVDAAVYAGLHSAYKASAYPIWEAGLVQFFLALPVHMAICSAIHARMIDIRLSEGVAVWFVEKLLKLVLLLAVGGAVAAVLLVRQLK